MVQNYIICCLQAIILDDRENLHYAFEGDLDSHYIYDIFKNGQEIIPIKQIRWYQKVVSRWYTNMGDYEVINKILDFKSAYYEILEEIMRKPSLEEMWETYQFYMFKMNQVGMVEIRDAETGKLLR